MKKLFEIFAGLGIVGALVAGALLAVGAGDAGSDSEAVSLAFSKAMELRQTLVVPPSGYSGGIMSTAIQEVMIARARNQLSTVFTPSLVQRELSHVNNVITIQQTQSVIALAGGIRDIHYLNETTAENTATLHALVTAWSKIAQIQPNERRVVATPYNTLDVHATLQKSSTGQWQVSQLSWNFTLNTTP